MKRINKAIVRHIPGLGRGRSQLAGRRKTDEPLAEIPQDIGSLGAARLVRVEGFRVGREAPLQGVDVGLLPFRPAAGAEQRKQCDNGNRT